MSSGALFQLFYGNDVAGATALLSRDGLQMGSTMTGPSRDSAGPKLSKQEINKRDPKGRTVLHLSASKGSLEFVKALLENPATDVNLLDMESGWSALHRALYNGRIACAQYIIANRGRETIKVKDWESNSPFDVFNSTLNGTNPPPLYHSKGGTDLFTFGSNKNNTLGFGDRDNRSHPEKVQVIRPARNEESAMSMFRPTRIRDVQMAKMHTAILTTDARDNLYVCGFNGTTGRLGLSTNQSTGTQFLPKPVLGINDPVNAVALGQDHTIVVTKSGAVWTWGSNQHGQLGYSLDLSVQKENVQKVPRKVISTLKKIDIIGVAASSIHSICFSKDELFTWGLNRGQLGYSTGEDDPIQSVPRKIASLPAPVEMVTAIDHATICLLTTKVVMIFANSGSCRVSFPLDLFGDNFTGVSQSSVFRPRQMYAPNIITKITSGGNTVCAVSSMGDVFSFSLPDSKTQLKPNELAKSIRAQRIWSLRRRHMAVRDVAVGQDGTVIISTESGSVWTRIRRAKPKISKGESPKEYKFARVGNLTRIVAVRANNAGAYAAIRNDVDLKGIEIQSSSLEDDMITTIPLYEVNSSLISDNDANMDSSDSEEMAELVEKEKSFDSDEPWAGLFLDLPPPSDTCDLAFVVRDGHRIYLHKAMLACRSSPFRDFLVNPSMAEFNVNLADGVTYVHMEDVGIVAVAQLVNYIYTDQLMDLPEEKDNHKTERLEMIKELRILATRFRLKALSDVLQSSWYIVLRPEPSLRKHLRSLQNLSPEIVPQDAVLCLSDREVACHSFVLAARCPFFEAMLDSSGLGGGWVGSRRQAAILEGASEFKIQLKHLSYGTMTLVLEHIYCDAGEDLFNNIKKETSEEFLEFVIEVMAVANELLLDRLKDVCQSVLAKFVTLRNVATILEEADVYVADQLKDASLDYCAINGEALLENRLLDDLEPELMADLEVRIREKQIERLPISRGEVLLHDLTARYPELEDDIQQEREARQFTSNLGTSLSSSFGGTSLPSTPIDWRQPASRPSSGRKGKRSVTPIANSPLFRPVPSDMIFDMDDDLDVSYGSPAVKPVRPVDTQVGSTPNPWRDASGKPLKEQPPTFSSNQRFRVLPESVSADINGRETRSELKTSTKGKRENGMKTVEGTPSKPSPQVRPPSGVQSPAIPLSSPSLSTPGASPWRKAEQTKAIPFKSLVEEQSNQILSSTFPPSTHTLLLERPIQSPKQAPVRPNLPPSISTDATIPQRYSSNPMSVSATPPQVRSVPGKSFQQKPPTSPMVPEMFPVLGASPQNLADIIAQQTSEQAALNAKALPRSLKEIQEEEQFLQWWEQESRRIKDEEELLAKTVEISMREGRGRGGRGRGGRGRGGRGRGERGRCDFGRGESTKGQVHNRGK